MAKLHAERMGRRIKEIREDLKKTDEKWTQAYVAHEINARTKGKLQGADISRWEAGKHKPEDHNLEALAEVLGVDVAEFYSDPPDKSKTPDLFAVPDPAEPTLADVLTQLDAMRTDLETELAEMRTELGELAALLAQRSSGGS